MKKVFIAGAGGYIGTRMVEYFLHQKIQVIALDRFFFGSTLAHLSKHKKLSIIKDDVRSFDQNLLRGVDVVINLASISNDPASELDPNITYSINYEGALYLARAAKAMKVKRYIFSSSCSVYGAGKGIVNENTEVNPLSSYAQSKTMAEKDLLAVSTKEFCVTVFRLATVYGLSKQRMRFDLIINIMTLYAWREKKIFILGGGKQWRPLIHIQDAIEAFYTAATTKHLSSLQKQIFNVGSNEQNYQVIEVAKVIRRYFPDIIFEEIPDDPDQRSYRVDFSKIQKVLGFYPKYTVKEGIKEIYQALEKSMIQETIKTNTLKQYQYLIETDKILSEVRLHDKLF